MALLLSILITGILLSMVLTLSAIFIPKLKLAVETKNSVSAIYAAETGVEWCLYVNRVNSSQLPPIMTNGATFTDQDGDTLDAADCATSPVKVIGVYRGITRAYEINF